MDNASLAFFVWGLASAIAVASLGIFTLGGGRTRPRGAMAFGLFALAWGLQVTAGVVAAVVTSVSVATTAYLLFVAFLILLPYFLVEFAASQSGLGARAWLALRAAAGVLAFGLAVALALRPAWFLEGVNQGTTRIVPDFGPLFAPLVIFPYFTAFGVVLWVLWRATREAPTARVGVRSGILLGGLGVYLSFAAGNNFAFYVHLLALSGWTSEAGLFAALFAGLFALAIFIGVEAMARARRARARHERVSHLAIAAAMLAPGGYGVAEAFLVFGPYPTLESVGLWRLLGVAIIAYGIARWRIYDLPQKATKAAANATGTGAALASGAAAYGAGTLFASGPALPLAAGALVVLAAFLPSLQFARRLFGVDRGHRGADGEGALYGQRIDSYRAALEASLARGTLDEDRVFLSALRERFAITPDEDRLLTHLARSSVLVARDARAWDAYERLRLLGEGGGGRTWLARDRARDRLVVLKEPLARWQQDAGARETVLREARLAAKVRHPNVVLVEEVVEGRGPPVIVMEYAEGGSLADLLRARGTLEWPRARALALDVLAGLEAIHANGIVHRDIKPSNVLLDGEGVAKVCDFGIAVAPGSHGAQTVLLDPASTTVAGTLPYMAPEARDGSAPDRRADVYSAAALLHEMLHGAPPGLPSPVVVRDDLPAALASVLEKALATTPQERYATARAFAEELSRV